MRAIIAFAGYTRTIGVRNSRRYCDMYVYSVSWSGRNNEIKKFIYGPDRAKAAQFGTATAADLAKQLAGRRFNNVNVRVIAGDRVESFPTPPPSVAEKQLAEDIRQFVSDVKQCGPAGALLKSLTK